MDYDEFKKEWWQVGAVLGAVLFISYAFYTNGMIDYMNLLLTSLAGMLIGGAIGFLAQAIEEGDVGYYLKAHATGAVALALVFMLTLNAYVPYLPFQLPIRLPFATLVSGYGAIEVVITDTAGNRVQNVNCNLYGGEYTDGTTRTTIATTTRATTTTTIAGVNKCTNPTGSVGDTYCSTSGNFYTCKCGTTSCVWSGSYTGCKTYSSFGGLDDPLNPVFEQPYSAYVIQGDPDYTFNDPWRNDITGVDGLCRFDNIPTGEVFKVKAICLSNTRVTAWAINQAGTDSMDVLWAGSVRFGYVRNFNCGTGCVPTTTLTSCKNNNGHVWVVRQDNCDNIQSWLTDCTAANKSCSTYLNTAECTTSGIPTARCGDGICQSMESCSSCSTDCGPCPTLPDENTCSPDCLESGYTGGVCKASESACGLSGMTYNRFGNCPNIPNEYCCCSGSRTTTTQRTTTRATTTQTTQIGQTTTTTTIPGQLCNFNSYCEPALGETFATCASDCKCNYNNECEITLGEIHSNCPSDCPIGVTTTTLACGFYNQVCCSITGSAYATCTPPLVCSTPYGGICGSTTTTTLPTTTGWPFSTEATIAGLGVVGILAYVYMQSQKK